MTGLLRVNVGFEGAVDSASLAVSAPVGSVSGSEEPTTSPLEFDGAGSSPVPVGAFDGIEVGVATEDVSAEDVSISVGVAPPVEVLAGGTDDEGGVIVVHSGEPDVVSVPHPVGFGVDEHAEAPATTLSNIASRYPLRFFSNPRCVCDAWPRASKARLGIWPNGDIMSCVYCATQFSTIAFQMASAVTLEPCALGWIPSDVYAASLPCHEVSSRSIQ